MLSLKCWLKGHHREAIKSDRLYFQKGGVRSTKDYYEGEYLWCACGWTQFIGRKRPYARSVLVKGREVFIS